MRIALRLFRGSGGAELGDDLLQAGGGSDEATSTEVGFGDAGHLNGADPVFAGSIERVALMTVNHIQGAVGGLCTIGIRRFSVVEHQMMRPGLALVI